MFRYIALHWDPADTTAAAIATRHSDAVRTRPGWHASYIGPGLHVHTTGTRRGINGDSPLGSDHGVVVGRLFRRRGLERPSPGDMAFLPDEVRRVVDSHGRELIHAFWGRYVAFVHLAPGRSIVIRDPCGTLPCHVIEHGGVSIVFSWLEDIIDSPGPLPSLAVDRDCLTAHVVLGELGGHETVLRGVSQILPGESRNLGRDPGPPTLLWSAVDIARNAMDEEPERAATRLHRTVQGCARAWAEGQDNILLRLSGGVDSSILLSCLAPGGTRAVVTCLNYHSPGADSDERVYARTAAARARCQLIERERDAGFHLARVLDVALTPAPATYLGRMGTARTDAELSAALGGAPLFTGGGGDQLFFEFRRWWPAADYLRTRGVDAGLLRAVMDAARLGRMSVWKVITLAIADRIRRSDPLQGAGQYLGLVRPEAMPPLHGLKRFVHPSLRSSPGLSIGKLTQTSQLLHPGGYYDPFLREAAPELVNPLLSQPLVELCLGLPTYVLTHGGRGRGLARSAFAADIPSEIATRRTKGGMEEHLKTVLLNNLDFARGMLLEGELVRHGILDRASVEDALSGRAGARTSHLGEIHVCIGIEAWLARWSSRGVRIAD